MSSSSIVAQLRAYLPSDRVSALFAGQDLPARAFGAVLFADISGFTPLTEAVIARFGARRGGEEFTNRLNGIYEALITEIESFGGSIIGFAGDAMTVWFADDNGTCATATAFALQTRMRECGRIVWPDGETIELSMKVAVSSGTLRRFQAGDPDMHLIDVLAGSVMIRVAACEELARPGEVVVDGRTAGFLGDALAVESWRETAPGTKPAQVAVVSALRSAVVPAPRPVEAMPEDAVERLRPWLLPEVARRVMAGQNIFLTELRPAVALFVRFGGIDFDADPEAPEKLDRYIRWVQRTVANLEGSLLQLTIGEKGNYLYAAWGAPVAHDDDSRRALLAALALQQPPPEIASTLGPVEIGVARGTMRTGAYGSPRRRTYGVLGDETNLAARLMARASPGETLVSDAIARHHLETFELESLPPVRVKGKAEPVTLFRLHAQRVRGLLNTLRGSSRDQPLVGRKAELDRLRACLAEARGGAGQLVSIEAEAGVGKTRLLAEVVSAAGPEFGLFAGDCPVLARESSFAVWTPIWRDFFGLGGENDATAVLNRLEGQLSSIDPAFAPRAPLLGTVLGLVLPENDLTRSLDPKVRRSSLESLLLDCVRAAAERRPLLFILDESHWIDEPSRHLLGALAQAIARCRVMVLVAHRPVEEGALFGPDEASLPYLHQLPLGDLPPDEAREFVLWKLAEVYADTGSAPPDALVELIVGRSGGNPFFIEEVANLLRLRHADLGDPALLENLELPDSLHSLVLGRIDQMSESGQTTLKVASVIGRQFAAAMLFEVDPLERADEILRPHLREMQDRGVVLSEAVGEEEAYLFRHIVIQEVAYETLPYSLRARIHETIGAALEMRHGDHWQPIVHLLAFHYGRSTREDKQRHYFVAAGDASRAAYALQAAIGYYERALPLLEAREAIDVRGRLAEVLELDGRWDDAFCRYREARFYAERDGTPAQRAHCAALLGDFHRKRGEYDEAAKWLELARSEGEALGDEHGVAHVLHIFATLRAQQGRFDEAVPLFHEALAIRERLGEDAEAGRTLNNLGIVSRARGDVPGALDYYERSLALRRRVQDRREIANSLNNLGYAYRFSHDYERARAMLEESISLNRAVGDQWSIANALTSLAELALDIEDAELAETCLRESMAINRDLGDRRALAFLLEAFGHLGRLREHPAAALVCFLGARRLREQIGAPLEPANAEELQSVVDKLGTALPPGEPERLERALAGINLTRLLDLAVSGAAL